MNAMKIRTTWLLPLLLTPLLAGCFGAAVVGMGAGAMMAADRRTSDTYLTDEAIELRAGNRISERFRDKVHVNVTSFNRMALLTGEVPDQATRTNVEKLVEEVPNLKAITNELSIAGNSSFAARSSDSYLTTKVKARFTDSGKFSINHVKVVTESGTVFLMGLVTQAEADAAADIARTTSGVMKVVRVFEIISPEEARRLDNRPSEDKAPKPSAN